MSEDPTRVEDPAATVADPGAAGRVEALARAEGDLHDLLVGAMIGGYRIDAVLGRGGMGVVYKAWDTRLARAVALKTVLLESRETLVRFRREARSHAQLRHPNVVPLYLIDEHAGLTYVVMDLVEGGSLRDLLDREGRLPEPRALAIIAALSSALGAAHARGMVHRDVKPSNVLIDAQGRPLLADFGLARAVAEAGTDEAGPMSAMPRSLRTRGAIGTPAYFPPEQSRGEPVDHRADMYALGVTLYELVAGKRPPSALARDATTVIDPPSAIVPGLSPELDALCLKLLAFEPVDRFATYAELDAALAAAAAVHAVPEPDPPASWLLRAPAFALDYALLGVLSGGMFSAHVPWVIRALGGPPEERTQSVCLALAWPVTALTTAIIEGTTGVTIGKLALRIVVHDMDGNRVRLGRALARNAVKWAPMCAAFWTPRSLPHAGGFVLFLLAALVVVPGFGTKPMLHDRLAGTRVVRRPKKARA